MKRIAIAVTAVAALACLWGAGYAANRPDAAQLVKRVNVAATEFKFTLSAQSAKRGVVIFKVMNTGALKHDFAINGRKTKMLSHGQSDTLRVTFLRKGAYPYKCTVPGHAAAGMKGVFTIT